MKCTGAAFCTSSPAAPAGGTVGLTGSRGLTPRVLPLIITGGVVLGCVPPTIPNDIGSGSLPGPGFGVRSGGVVSNSPAVSEPLGYLG